MSTFNEVFQEVRVDGQEPCPECHGVGWMKGFTLYVERMCTTAFICPLCQGTGSVRNTHKPNLEAIKDQMFLAKHFHEMDPTQVDAQ